MRGNQVYPAPETSHLPAVTTHDTQLSPYEDTMVKQPELSFSCQGDVEGIYTCHDLINQTAFYPCFQFELKLFCASNTSRPALEPDVVLRSDDNPKYCTA